MHIAYGPEQPQNTHATRRSLTSYQEVVFWPSHVQNQSGIGKTHTMLCSFTKATRKNLPIRFKHIGLHSVRLTSHIYVITTNARIYRCRHTDNIYITVISVSSSIRIIAQTFSICSNSSRRFGGVAFHTQLTTMRTTRRKIYSRVWLT